MIAPTVACLAAALIFTASVDLLAQQDAPVAPGARVRVSAPSIVNKRLVGTVVALKVDTLVVDAKGRRGPLALPLAFVTGLEVSRGRKSNVGKGAGLGFLAGAFGGAILGLVTYEECTGFCPVDPGAGGTALILAVVLGGVGAGLGAVIGAVIPSERWETVPLDRIRVGLIRHERLGLTVSASVAF